MKKVVKKTTEKYVTEAKFGVFEKTFESSMRSIAKSFSDQNETLKIHTDMFKKNGEVMELMLKEIKNIHEDNKYFKQNISSLNSDGLSYDRKIENLTLRVEKLESKNK